MSMSLGFSRSHWPRGLRRTFAAVRLPISWVRITPITWMFVRCECRVFSDSGHCDELINRPEESYRVWCVCDLETLANGELFLSKKNVLRI
jgi:hypothetical protein